MLVNAVESYLSVRRACGFDLKSQGNLLRSFAAFSEARGKRHVCSQTAIEWSGLARSIYQRARRLGHVIRFARYIRAEDRSHELPPAVYGSTKQPRRTPYIFSPDDMSVSSTRRLSPVILSGDRPTARSSLCFHARECACRRQSGCALRTSPRMACSSGAPNSAKAASCPCTQPRGPDSNGTLKTASPMPPSTTTYLFR